MLRIVYVKIINVLKRYGKGVIMERERSQSMETERPIAKPDYPLPALFSPSKRAELPTKREAKHRDTTFERAHFYRKQWTESGAPVYGFYISREGAERENPGAKH